MNSTRYFKLGLFVLTGMTLVVGAIVILGAGSLFTKTIYAETYFDESVVGLEVGSPVKYRGVTVGRVKRILFAASKYTTAVAPGPVSRQILIEMSLNTDAASEFGGGDIAKGVQEGLRTRLMQSAITGTAYLGLDFFDPQAFPPTALNWKPEGVYVPSVTSTMTEVVTTVDRLMSELEQADLPGALKRFNTLLDGANRVVNELKISEVQQQAVSLLSEVRETNAHVKQILDDPKLQTAIRDFPDITDRLKKSAARADEILHDKRLDQTLTSLADASSSAAPAVADAKRVMRDMRELLGGQQDDLRSIITELRSAIANLNATTEDAKSNPARLIFGQPPVPKKPGE